MMCFPGIEIPETGILATERSLPTLGRHGGQSQVVLWYGTAKIPCATESLRCDLVSIAARSGF